ncbi:MAG: excinuclease ABC subunit UvrC [bacterium]
MIEPTLEAKADSLPDCPGVYTFKDSRGKIIYVGKAKSLRSRVKSYFRGDALAPRTVALVAKARGLDFIVTSSEVEALILECNLIKHFRPRYNVNLKDDKKYPYIKVTAGAPFPGISATRNLSDRTARYFGPYTDARAMRRSLKVLTEVFPIRACKRDLPLARPDRGCLNYHIGKCVGPCRGDVASEAYKKIVRQVCDFLSGKVAGVTRQLKASMEAEAAGRRFEEAACLRDRIRALEKMAQRQTAVSTDRRDRDVVAVRRGDREAVGVALRVREGKIVGKEVYRLGFEGEPSDREIVSSFLELYLDLATDLPAEVVLEERLDGAGVIEEWLRAKTGKRIRVMSPKRGRARALVRMAVANAQLALAQTAASRPGPRVANSVKELTKWLNLAETPETIEAFDISTTQGSQPVGSRVCFKNARPAKRLYRHYAIKGVSGQDDFGMMREVLKRSWGHVVAGEEARPNLVLIDGGRGQVSSAIEGMLEAGERSESLPAVVGIAKRLDELWLPGRPQPVQIPHSSSALRLLQRIRDEAHRFAVTYHRKVRTREGTRSILETVPGIGPALTRRLLAQFGSLEGLRKAGVSDLARVKGITAKKAEAVVVALSQNQ